jgi:hypothetical protein
MITLIKSLLMQLFVLFSSGKAKKLLAEESGKFFVDEGMSIILAILVFGLIIVVVNASIPDFFETIFQSAKDSLVTTPTTAP